MPPLSPATLEGWYALHQMMRLDWAALRALSPGERRRVGDEARELFEAWSAPESGGWSAAFRLVGHGADWLFLHFRPSLEELGDLQLRLRRSAFGQLLDPEYDYLSVTEAGFYDLTAEVAGEVEPGSKEFQQLLAQRLEAEASSAYVQKRLYPQIPEGMRYVSFYPMDKRRDGEDNWYVLPVEERNRLMREHGFTGRRFAGRVFQVITGSVGLDDWEWGVTLFSRDPLEFKRIVTDMRYDEVSARYGEFGEFFTGIRLEPAEWPALLEGE